MSGIYLYLTFIFIIFVFLGYKVITKKKREKQSYEEREDNVFYDAAKKIRRD
jgi:amino acid permease